MSMGVEGIRCGGGGDGELGKDGRRECRERQLELEGGIWRGVVWRSSVVKTFWNLQMTLVNTAIHMYPRY